MRRARLMARSEASVGGRGGTLVRCAVYTRKSSEEGLEQDFNSLHAQREACEAYVRSQKHEGWVVLPAQYDDGGISGATMERPALQQLLADIRARKVDTVVVYKVDRLTRSLADFAKIVEIFDAHSVPFVSVTQHFNTTTSMGRLTLNVLLSFAQFEREVAGERIRDKIAASKQRGMWMGGNPPLGYDIRDRNLVVNEVEAGTVRHIFHRYVAFRSVRLLAEDLADGGIASKQWLSTSGRQWGGQRLARGALYLMLQNRIYLGEIVHKDRHYPGQHAPIVDQALWDQVQEHLAANAGDRRSGRPTKQPSLLVGLIFDSLGHRMSPTHAVKGGKRYRYYLSRPLVTEGRAKAPGAYRIPAPEVEQVVTDRVRTLLADGTAVFDTLNSTTAATSWPRKRQSWRDRGQNCPHTNSATSSAP
jgi:site-specific DNA recombinase